MGVCIALFHAFLSFLSTMPIAKVYQFKDTQYYIKLQQDYRSNSGFKTISVNCYDLTDR